MGERADTALGGPVASPLFARPELSEVCDDEASARQPMAQRIVLTLEACANKKRALSFTELVNETGLAKTTVHRICWKLAELGLLEHSPEGFSIGSKLFVLANANPVINELRNTAMPYLLDLQRRTGAMTELAILSGHKALILDGLYTRESSPVPRLVGHALPLHCTAAGKAIAARLEPEEREGLLFTQRRLPAATRQTIVRPSLLREHLDRVRSTGVATCDEEFLMGVRAAASGFKVRGEITAAIGCLERWNFQGLRQVAGPLAAAAAELEQALAEP
jgi:DNA-binding IclR family transcriptional regulator